MATRERTSRQSSGHPLLRFLQSVNRAIALLEGWALSWGILLMVGLGTANVLGRNLFDHSLSFAEEINQMLIVVVTFLGVGYAARQGRHIRMTALYDQPGRRVQRILMVTIACATAALLFALSYYAAVYVAHVRSVGSVTPGLQLPLYLVYLAVPLGLALGGVQYALTAIRNLTSDGVFLSFDRRDEISDGAGGPSMGDPSESKPC